MKRIVICLLAGILAISCMGCMRKEPPVDGLVFYYKRADMSFGAEDGVVAYEIREQSQEYHNNTEILNAYLEGPHTAELFNVFPEDCVVMLFTVRGKMADIFMSDSFGNLQGIDFTIACVCLTKTVMELVDVETVQISVSGILPTGENYVVMNKNNILLLEQSISEAETKQP